MSNFLAFNYGSVPMAYSILQWQNLLAGFLTANGWQLAGQVDSNYSDFLPPTGESVGNSFVKEYLRIYFTATTTQFGSYQKTTANAWAQSFVLTAKTAGAVAAAVTIDGALVTGATGSAGSTAVDNLRALYYALIDSGNATILGWKFSYNGTDTITAENSAITTAKTITPNANINYIAQQDPILSGRKSGFALVDTAGGYSVTHDLVNGFIYFLQINSRSVTLATKTLVGYYGPAGGTYVDHSSIDSQNPNPTLCSPIELLVHGYANAYYAVAKPTHYWAQTGNQYLNGVAGPASYPSTNSETYTAIAAYEGRTDWQPFSGAGRIYSLTDVGIAYGSGPGAPAYYDGVNLANEMLVTSGCSSDNFTIHQVGAAVWSSGTPRQNSVRYLPSLRCPDVFRWVGAQPSELLALAPSPADVCAFATTLNMVMDATTAYTTITLTSTSGLDATGGAVDIGGEIVTFTGITGSTITGCSRAYNGTPQIRHRVGDPVTKLSWFLKIQNGALLCGSVRPT